jgi:hypothetical protein
MSGIPNRLNYWAIFIPYTKFNTWKILKCVAGEGRRRSAGPIVWEMKYYTVKEERNIIRTVKISHCLRMNCILKCIIEGKIEGAIQVTGRQKRRCKQLLDDFKETTGYWKLKEDAIDCTLWRTRFGWGYGLVVTQTTERKCKQFQNIAADHTPQRGGPPVGSHGLSIRLATFWQFLHTLINCHIT